MNETLFRKRLSELRMQLNISARDMSLSLGQNPSYINNIETGKALPSMANFFIICDYLHVTPSEFFNFENENPRLRNEIEQNLSKINPRQMAALNELLKTIIN